MKTINLKLKYDKEADAAYIYFTKTIKGKISSTDSFTIEDFLEFGEINIDFALDKKILGIEIFDASKILPQEILSQS